MADRLRAGSRVTRLVDMPTDQHLPPQDSLAKSIEFIKFACEKRGDSPEVTQERIRFAEILWHHTKGRWVKKEFITRALNFICNPETWEDWKSRGGDKLAT